MTLYIVAAVWLVCGVLGYGIAFAWLQGAYPYFAWRERRNDIAFATSVGLTGPLGLLVVFFMSGFAQYGLRYRPMPRAESEAAWRKRFPLLSFDDAA